MRVWLLDDITRKGHKGEPGWARGEPGDAAHLPRAPRSWVWFLGAITQEWYKGKRGAGQGAGHPSGAGSQGKQNTPVRSGPAGPFSGGLTFLERGAS